MTLEQVLADIRGEAQALRFNGHKAQADGMERICEKVSAAAADYLTWYTEEEAVARSNFKAHWFRTRFPEWEAQGMAKKEGRVRCYRQPVVPRRPNLEAARADALRHARKVA